MIRAELLMMMKSGIINDKLGNMTKIEFIFVFHKSTLKIYDTCLFPETGELRRGEEKNWKLSFSNINVVKTICFENSC